MKLFQPSMHESGLKHTSGEALYVDDLPLPPKCLIGWLVTSPHAHANILKVEKSQAQQLPRVACILTAEDIPGANNVGPVVHDEELFAKKVVHYVGQVVAVVFADTYEHARAAAKAVKIEYQPLKAITSIEDAIAEKSFLAEGHKLEKGNVQQALAASPVVLKGTIKTGGQDHFYLETQVALALPEEGGTFRILSSTQHPSEVQALVAENLNVRRHDVVVEVPRMGGGFGGKETQAAQFACYAALAAQRTNRPAKVWLNRDTDMVVTGKRHPFLSHYEAGFSPDGEILALKVDIFSDGGFSTDLSRAILDRALFHLDNAYNLPHALFDGKVAKTNLPSNTAFRGFGGPQGMAVIESVLQHASEVLGIDASLIREKNFYREAPSNLTPYAQEVTDSRSQRIFEELKKTAGYSKRLLEVGEFNRVSNYTKRGLALTPVKFGISFTTSFLNQAGAYVLIFQDGSVQVNHGGTEMGQGLHSKMLAIAAHELGIASASIRIMTTATDKVPNTSATAASSGTDLNGQAVRRACAELKDRLRIVAQRLLNANNDDRWHMIFENDFVFLKNDSTRRVAIKDVVNEAYVNQVPLSATGFYKTPNIHFDKATGKGKPFHYFAYGAALSEVEVNGLTGEFRLRRTDILHDCGASLLPSIDLGQIEGGFIQGLGWLTTEEVIFDDKGVLKTHSPDTYKIPAFGDAPREFNVKLLERAEEPNVIFGSKAVGEPPLMLALSVVMAMRHAITFYSEKKKPVELSIPCTPEAILNAVELQKNS